MSLRPWLPGMLCAVGCVAGVDFSSTQAALAVPPHPGEAEIRQRLEEVLARPEFQGEGKEPWWLDYVHRFFQWLAGLSGSAPSLYWVILGTCVVLLVLLV